MNTRGAVLRSKSAIILSALLLAPFTAFAAPYTLVIGNSAATPAPKTKQISMFSAAATTSATETSTSYYSFNHYPANWPYSPTPWSGAYMQGVGLRTDRFLTIWYVVYGIWDYDIAGETWEATFLKSDGTVVDGWRWQTSMETVNGVYEKCYNSYHLPDGTYGGRFCKDDPTYGQAAGVNTIYFGTSRGPLYDPIAVDSIKVTHNTTELHTEQYLLSDLGLIDPNSPYLYGTQLIQNNGALNLDVDAITSQGPFTTPFYAATDGITPLFYKAASVSTIPVTFQLQSLSTSDGTLSDLFGAQGPTSVQPALLSTSQSDLYALGIYQVPSQLGTTAASRPIQILVSFALPWKPDPTVLFFNLTLIRPPVLLIYGTWGNPNVWNPLVNSSFGQQVAYIKRVDWAPADGHLAGYMSNVNRAIQDALSQLRFSRVAVTTFDVIGHSAGGLLARLWTQTGSYRRVENFMRGDFRKVITLGTPHKGAEIAGFAQRLINSNSLLTNSVQMILSMNHMSLTNGAMADQVPGSPFYQTLRASPVRAQAWMGTAATLSATDDEYLLWQSLSVLCKSFQSMPECQGVHGTADMERLRANVFGLLPNDAIVSSTSQADALPVSATATLAGTTHTEEPTNGSFILSMPPDLDTDTGYSDAGFP